MTPDTLVRALRDVTAAMRSKQFRWPHTYSYGGLDVVYSDKVDEWADDIENAILRDMTTPTSLRSCLQCEGRGTVRDYINVAGNYNVKHCPACHGTGKEESQG